MTGTGPVIGSAIGSVSSGRTVGTPTTGSAVKRGVTPNIDAVTLSRVGLDPTTTADLHDLAGTIKGSVENILTSHLGGLFESQSQPPNGVSGAGGAGGAPKTDGANAAGGAGPQKATTSNAANGGLSPAQMSALNSQNKLDPVTLSNMLADKTNETAQRRDPSLLEKGQPTADPEINEVLTKLSQSLSEKIEKFNSSLEDALKKMDDDQFKKEFKNSGFDGKKDLFDFVAGMKAEVEGKNGKDYAQFNQDRLDRFNKFLDSAEKSELHGAQGKDGDKFRALVKEGREIADQYQKGLDLKEKDWTAGNFKTTLNDLRREQTDPETGEKSKSLLEQFKSDTDAREISNPDDADTQDKFLDQASKMAEKAERMFNDPNVGAQEMQDYMDGEFNDGITKLKELHEDLKTEQGFTDNDKDGKDDRDGSTMYGQKIVEHMMFLRFSSPHSEHSGQLETALESLAAEHKLDSPDRDILTRDDVLKNEEVAELYDDYYDKAFEGLDPPDNDYNHQHTLDVVIGTERSIPIDYDTVVSSEGEDRIKNMELSFDDGIEDSVDDSISDSIDNSVQEDLQAQQEQDIRDQIAEAQIEEEVIDEEEYV